MGPALTTEVDRPFDEVLEQTPEARDPDIMVTLTGSPALADVVPDARTRLTDALRDLGLTSA